MQSSAHVWCNAARQVRTSAIQICALQKFLYNKNTYISANSALIKNSFPGLRTEIKMFNVTKEFFFCLFIYFLKIYRYWCNSVRLLIFILVFSITVKMFLSRIDINAAVSLLMMNLLYVSYVQGAEIEFAPLYYIAM